MADCWTCGAERGDASFCTSCGKIQPIAKNATFFGVLGLPRAMRIDPSALEKSFRELSKKVHPDRFGNATPVERRLALEHTTFANDAYRTLKDPQRRAEYLMSLDGVKIGREEATMQDPELLMEMLELQEKLEGEKSAEAIEAMRLELAARKKDLLERVARWFDEGEGTKARAIDALNELRFLERLIERIDLKLEDQS